MLPAAGAALLLISCMVVCIQPYSSATTAYIRAQSMVLVNSKYEYNSKYVVCRGAQSCIYVLRNVTPFVGNKKRTHTRRQPATSNILEEIDLPSNNTLRKTISPSGLLGRPIRLHPMYTRIDRAILKRVHDAER